MKKPYQPKDTGKLTNYHYGNEKYDRRDEEALTNNGVQNMEQIRPKKK